MIVVIWKCHYGLSEYNVKIALSSLYTKRWLQKVAKSWYPWYQNVVIFQIEEWSAWIMLNIVDFVKLPKKSMDELKAKGVYNIL